VVHCNPVARERSAAVPDWPTAAEFLVTFDPQPALQQGELDLVMTSDILPRSGLHYSPMFDYEVRLVLAPAFQLWADPRRLQEVAPDIQPPALYRINQ
jgi:DNA-binding transcriptional LysR family regulator